MLRFQLWQMLLPPPSALVSPNCLKKLNLHLWDLGIHPDMAKVSASSMMTSWLSPTVPSVLKPVTGLRTAQALGVY
jgi:hypothetical protein